MFQPNVVSHCSGVTIRRIVSGKDFWNGLKLIDDALFVLFRYW